MTLRRHLYRLSLAWSGNLGTGTSNYRAYARDHAIESPGKAPIEGSADAAFRGDPARWSPEELLIASVAACHQLWYLHLCADQGITVVAYRDAPESVMLEDAAGGGRFAEIVLYPQVEIGAGDDASLAHDLHDRAHRLCFIANSVNFPVRCEPVIVCGS